MPDIIRLLVAASTTSTMLTIPNSAGHSEQMEWLVEFEGRQAPMDGVWNDYSARIVAPLRSTIKRALDKAADPAEHDGVRVVVYAEEDADGPSWGFKFAGSAVAVNYAVSLMGNGAPVLRQGH